MIIERPAAARGVARMGWLDSRHTFSFADYHDPRWMGFGPLRVINEDRVAPGAGFPPHRHANMEILSYVLAGALAHRDSGGGGGVLRPGELQWMSAGHGVEHSEYNADEDAQVHFLQIWIQPDRVNAEPAYAQRAFDPAQRRMRWGVLASPAGSADSIAIRQQAWLRGVLLGVGEAIEVKLDPARRYWLHVASGAVQVDERRLGAGSALGYVEEAGTLRLTGVDDEDPATGERLAGDAFTGDVADVLLLDLPG